MYDHSSSANSVGLEQTPKFFQITTKTKIGPEAKEIGQSRLKILTITKYLDPLKIAKWRYCTKADDTAGANDWPKKVELLLQIKSIT